MSFLNDLFNRKKPNKNSPNTLSNQELLKEVRVTPDLVLPKVLADYFPEIEKTARQTVSIIATPSDNLSIRQSKFGHYPCLPKGFSYPTDEHGNYLYPLAQINFSEVPHLDHFPKSGYLQFYIGTDDVYGLNFDDWRLSNFKVLFFEESEVDTPEENFDFLDEGLNLESVPVYKSHELSFELQTEYVGLEDLQGGNGSSFNLYDIMGRYPSIENEIEKAAYYVFSRAGHKLGGYAYFTQSDPRGENKAIKNYVLLFQMDSDQDIMWGDSGVANFFIDSDDLAKKDFSKVFYTWDCC